MVVSGAGKTTLINVLAGQKTGGYIEGDTRISGYPKNQVTFATVSGYCEQNDIHSLHVTVEESLLYSAWLHLPADPLGVDGFSTEQRKRLIIAIELVANPSIIFMDEPTSGLDARAAAIVMRAVRNTVDIGRTVVCTIHQPSIDIFESFDDVFPVFESVVAVERTVFYRERAAGMFSALPYAFAQVRLCIQTFVYRLLLYSMIGFEWQAEKFLWFYYYVFMYFVYFTLYGTMHVALTPSYQIAAILMSFFLSFWNLFSANSSVVEVILLRFSSGMDLLWAYVGWALLFFFVFVYGIKVLNFQRR
ncbi:unnamed protein product [Fraxinus pennsylvanica]|uniref:ABC transporter domain-containing protein n=1 Tax=Fraxinus pennsylvanica TaxID=56036 RepID=A0AAD1ZND3_9LAMI|nr:unnamed protein product [Fraxinus pennsylvanica]